jgi:tetratricopeptide (TPR) repeat protein
VARVKALDGRGLVARGHGDNAVALDRLNESLALARELGDLRGIGDALNDLGGVFIARGDLDRAFACCTEALETFRAAGDRRSMANARTNLIEISSRREDWPAVLEAANELIAFGRAINDSLLLGNSLDSLALSLRMTGERTRPRALLREAFAVFQELGFHYGLAWTLCEAGGLVTDSGQATAGATLLAAGEARYQAIGVSMDPVEQTRFEQDAARARAVLGEAAFASAWTEGAELTVDEAVDEAMGALAEDR